MFFLQKQWQEGGLHLINKYKLHNLQLTSFLDNITNSNINKYLFYEKIFLS